MGTPESALDPWEVDRHQPFPFLTSSQCSSLQAGDALTHVLLMTQALPFLHVCQESIIAGTARATKCGDLLPSARAMPGSHRSLSFSMGGAPMLSLAFCIQEIHGIIHGLEH